MLASGRSPYGERGLKSSGKPFRRHAMAGRSPYGERGLKYEITDESYGDEQSLSLRRAWIEILG